MSSVRPWTADNIQHAAGGMLVCGNPAASFGGISIDSRKIKHSDLFVAICGEIHDGHRFTRDVVDQGVKGLLINRDQSETMPISEWARQGVTCIAVTDTTRALGALAGFRRQQSGVQLVAITGSNGKTTTRQMTAAVVAEKHVTLATSGNFNNEIGLPLTLFNLEPRHQWAVVELGMNHPGEISRLADICRPDIGVVTNIGPAHLEGVGSIEGVKNAKGELIEKLPPEGTAVLNADDPNARDLARRAPCRVVLFGTRETADIRAKNITLENARVSFDLLLAGETVPVRLHTPGKFMVSNALAAAAVGWLADIDPQTIRAGLESIRPAHGRLHTVVTGSGISIIDDTYNSNPLSMTAAIETIRSVRGARRRVLVTGDMLELGTFADHLHREIGAAAAGAGLSRLYATGNFAGALAEAAAEAGMAARDIITGSREEIITDLENWLTPGDWVLIKGSRSMGMEKIVNHLIARDEN